MKTIAVTGGIGAGKSVVSDILRLMRYYVFDCDTEARDIMDNSETIKSELVRHIHGKAVVDGVIDRRLVSDIVFREPSKLNKLNAIIHNAVRLRLSQVIEEKSRVCDLMFVETAILYQSGLDRMVDEVWEVVADEEIRIERVMKRNSISREQVVARIESQRFQPEHTHINVHEIINDGFTAVIPQVLKLLGRS